MGKPENQTDVMENEVICVIITIYKNIIMKYKFK